VSKVGRGLAATVNLVTPGASGIPFGVIRSRSPLPTRPPGARLPALLLALGLIFSAAAPVSAQEQAPGERLPPMGPSGSLYLPVDHWVIGALARLDALPELGAVVPWGVGTPTRREALGALERAASLAPPPSAQDPTPEAVALAALARGWRDRLRQETGGDPGAVPRPVRWAGGHWDLRVGRRYGALGTGEGRYDFIAPEPLGEAGHLHAGLAGALEVGPVAVAGEARVGEDGVLRPRELHAAGRLGPVDLWAGRRAPAFAGGRGGRVVLGGAVPLDGGGLSLAGPRSLPGFLRHLGPVRFETHLARLGESGALRHPWFWAARGSVAPHPRLSLGLNRAAMFGGEGNAPITVKNVLLMLAGSRAEELPGDLGRSFFANQVASVELRWRPPLGGVPSTLYVEWGMEDSSGAWLNVPGFTAGWEVAAVPRAPDVALGIEVTYFAPECCGNPPWYRHASFTGGWAQEGLPLGHPLGGEGMEWLLHGRADLLDARLVSSWGLFHRKRKGDNLFMPDRQGTSRGASLEVLWGAGGRTDLVLDGLYESGEGGWSQLRAFLGIRSYF
jgi:hypothetical protein